MKKPFSEKIRHILQEFHDFAVKGNVMDLAIGVIVGGAFGKISTALVNDIIMPPLTYLLGGVNFQNLVWKIHKNGQDIVLLNYGDFINTILDFFIVTWAVFAMVLFFNRIKRLHEAKQAEEVKAAAAAAPVPPPSPEVVVLQEIRDMMKKLTPPEPAESVAKPTPAAEPEIPPPAD